MHGGVLLGAGSSVAHLAVAAGGTVRPREVSGLTDQLSAGLPRAPQLGAGLHVRAGLGGVAEGELALTVQAVAGARQIIRERQLPLRLVQQAVSCETHQQHTHKSDCSCIPSYGY